MMRALVPTRRGSRLVMRLYPTEIRSWINRHGGLSRKMIFLEGHDLDGIVRSCSATPRVNARLDRGYPTRHTVRYVSGDAASDRR